MPASNSIALFGGAVLITGLVGLLSVVAAEGGSPVPAIPSPEPLVSVAATHEIDWSIRRVLAAFDVAISDTDGALPEEIVQVLIAHGVAGRTSAGSAE